MLKEKMNRGPIHRLFGTDGIRSKVGQFPLDKDSLIKLGNSLGELFFDSKIIIGRDTRHSGEEIEKLITFGLSNKAKIYSCGIIPTPGISYITDHGDFDYGIMITASHNPFEDNGIKIFQNNGEKISEKLERRIENVFFSKTKPDIIPPSNKHLKTNIKEIYLNFLQNHASQLKGKKLKLVVDCANGATAPMAAEVLKKTDFDITVTHSKPDGKNINLRCGSTDPQILKETVIQKKADIGIAFDGDGDRVIFVDNRGNLMDGDHSLFTISKYLLHKDEKKEKKVIVGTVMSNLGLEKVFDKSDITFIRAQVGDKNVYMEMINHNAILGGEQAGHIILRDHQKTGDGILTAIFFLKSLLKFNLQPSDIFDQLFLFPQVTRSIKIKEKKDLNQWTELDNMVNEFKKKYGKNSRIMIRYSGTESKIRIMVESERSSIVNENINKFERLIKSSIGE